MALTAEIARATAKGMPYRDACAIADVAPSSYMRRNGRLLRGEEVLRTPGPRKVEEPDIGRLYDEILEMSHCRKRTHGTGVFYEVNQESISRRSLAEMIARARQEKNAERTGRQVRIEWNCPGYVWSFDETKWRGRQVLTVRDMGSKYRLPSLTGRLTGDRIAAWLEGLFERFGPPLIIKRDNGSALKCAEVDKVIGRWRVIPLDSPVHYPQYNGSVEQSQGELQKRLDGIIGCDGTDKEFDLGVDLAGHELNHIERRSLKGHISCEQFALGRAKVKYYTSRQRMEVYSSIRRIAAEMVAGMKTTDKRVVAAAWRTAVQSWLQENGLITVKQGEKVLPYFREKRSRN